VSGCFFGGCGEISAIFLNRVFELPLLRNTQKRDKKKKNRAKKTREEKQKQKKRRTKEPQSFVTSPDCF
jgi:hypothetical protein